MIDLHERLSEFSYGYGATREVERLLASIGLKAAPFLPSLLHEKELGFDVAFQKPGAVLMLQFKLGHSLSRFRRAEPGDSIPDIDRPFWRFFVNTAEPEGQFETLVKAQEDGAEVYYVAPRFVDWAEYLTHFEADQVLGHSVLVRPTDIRSALDSRGATDGWHRVVYDKTRTYVCSEPILLKEVGPKEMAHVVAEEVNTEAVPLASKVHHVFEGLESRHLVRREVPRAAGITKSQDLFGEGATYGWAGRGDVNAARRRRLDATRAHARSETDAVAAVLGTEVWSLGIQMILASKAT
jgi:hypothetical protein